MTTDTTGVFAFSSSDNILTSETLGSCTVNLEVNADSEKAYVGISANIAGGSYWANGKITPARLDISAAQLSGCLETSVENITSVGQDGANGTFEEDDYVGFTFSLLNAAGGLSAGVHKYKVGSGSFPTATNTEPGADVRGDAARQLSSQISANQRLVREGRSRFIQSRRQLAGEGSGIASRNVVDFDVDGALNIANGQLSTRGRVLDGAVHALHLAVGPRVVGLGKAMLDTVGLTDHVEAHWS